MILVQQRTAVNETEVDRELHLRMHDIEESTNTYSTIARISIWAYTDPKISMTGSHLLGQIVRRNYFEVSKPTQHNFISTHS